MRIVHSHHFNLVMYSKTSHIQIQKFNVACITNKLQNLNHNHNTTCLYVCIPCWFLRQYQILVRLIAFKDEWKIYRVTGFGWANKFFNFS